MPPSYLRDLTVPHFPNRALCSQTSGLFVVHRVFKGTMGVKAFSFQASFQWNSLPIGIWETDSLSTFRTRFKTFLFEQHIVRTGSGDSTPSLSYTAIGPDCWGLPMMSTSFSLTLFSLSLSITLYTTLYLTIS